MNRVAVVRSRTVVMPTSDIDTDQIIPARFLTTTTREGLGKVLFNDLRFHANGKPKADFVLNSSAAKNCKILVGGNNFGCGSSREHAPWALLDYGIRVIISTQIADIFRSNALKNGLIPVVVEPDIHARLIASPGMDVTVDLDALTLTLDDGTATKFHIDAFARHCLLQGIDQLGYLQQQSQAIQAFEENRTWTP
jgi:3-isopropylmalate/(R)-2-methylmalate dehydratase small subunit